MTPGTEAERPGETSSAPASQGQVMVSGQMHDGAREILEIVSALKEVEHGILRILCKEVRGHVGLSKGTIITGAEITSPAESGASALIQLLGVTKGMFSFLSVDNQPGEVNQSLNIDVNTLLQWRPEGTNQDPPIIDALNHFLKLATSPDQVTSVQTGKTETKPGFNAFMVWGDETEQGATTLPKLTALAPPCPGISAAPQVQPERIISDVLGDGPERSADLSAGSPRAAERISPPEMPPAPGPARVRVRVPELPVFPQLTAPPVAPTDQTIESLAESVANSVAESVAESMAELVAEPSAESVAETSVPVATESVTPTVKPVTSLLKPAQPRNDKPRATTNEHQTLRQKSLIEHAAGHQAQPTASTVSQPPLWRRHQKNLTIAFGIAALTLALALFGYFSYSNNYQHGIAALNRGDSAEAMNNFTACINATPSASTPYFYRALAQMRQENNDAAMKDFDSAIARDPKNILAYTGRAELKLKTKDYDAVIVDCDTILMLDSTLADAYRLQALAQNRNGHYNESVAACMRYFDKGVDQKPDGKVEVLANRASCYFNLDDYAKAIKDYSAAIELQPKNGSLFAGRARCFRAMHNDKKALADCKRALELMPADKSVQQLRDNCLVALSIAQRQLEAKNSAAENSAAKKPPAKTAPDKSSKAKATKRKS